MLVRLNRLTGSQPSYYNHKRLVTKRTHISKFVNSPPYKDREPTVNQSCEAIKINTKQHNKNIFINKSARVGIYIELKGISIFQQKQKLQAYLTCNVILKAGPL